MSTSLNLYPANGHLLITPSSEAEDTSSFGVVFQKDTSKNSLESGTLLDGAAADTVVSNGDTVYYAKDKFRTVSLQGEQYHLVKAEDVVAVSRKQA